MVRCLETRRRQGMKWRRYRTPEGVVFTTFEVPASVIGEIGKSRLALALARAERELQRRTRNAQVRQLAAAGWPTVAIAHEVGVCDSQARRILARSLEKKA